MIRTFPICQAPSHRHGESLRGIVQRLERELEHEAPRRVQLTTSSPALNGNGNRAAWAWNR